MKPIVFSLPNSQAREVLATGLNRSQSIRAGRPIESANLANGIKSRNALGPQWVDAVEKWPTNLMCRHPGAHPFNARRAAMRAAARKF
jgi:hypothetical protein